VPVRQYWSAVNAGHNVSMVSTRATGIGQLQLDLTQFRALATERRVVPVTRTLLADGETPLGVYRKLAQGRPGTFLFESAENGSSWSRWSFVGVHSVATLTEADGRTVWHGMPPAGLPGVAQEWGGTPLEALRASVAALQTEPLPGLPPLTGGMVGYLGYDVVRRLERLPELALDDLKMPELVMLLASDLAALDHHEGTITLIANAINWDGSSHRVDVDEAYHHALARLDAMVEQLCTPAPASAAVFSRPAPEFLRRRSPEQHHAAVEASKEAIRAGEAFQVVVSQRFEMATDADPLDIYRVLRTTNPSPHMYLLTFDEFSIVGCSPEALVTVRDGKVTTRPIAGTRPRGADPDEDSWLERDLLVDEKERAEHLMLVDLGRNDVGRVCRPGSVHVTDFFRVERYSHVMHLVSTVTGELAPGYTAFDAVTACFPAGTLSGAPKPRAMELIEELEPTRRGVYGGVVGYLDFAGDADTAIAIRTAMIRNGVAYVQAGGGIVADSNPEAEDAECLNKARAVLAAIAAAGTLRLATGEPAGSVRA
jgi:anthranilate synthase component 1